MLDIEVVEIRKITNNSKLRATADLKFNESVVVKGFSVIEGTKGVFVSMPRKIDKDGKWMDILTPTTGLVRDDIENKVLEAYDRETDGVKS
ncbi:MAG: septation protein SpoVG family protein [Candidatus Omnitrophica bacterium]|nr:septation protein SpoVG family protein [Candidatus Omnitrophota bacterium]